MDISQIMKLVGDPKVRQMVQGLMTQVGAKGGGGGMNGLLNQLKSAGLGEQVQSWVSAGNNQPVTGAQLEDALGPETINKIAVQAGTTPEQTASGLAKVLPKLIDEASPDGQMADPQEMQELMSELSRPAPAGQSAQSGSSSPQSSSAGRSNGGNAQSGRSSQPGRTKPGNSRQSGQGSQPGQSARPAKPSQPIKPAG